MTKEEWTAEAKRRAEEWSWNKHPGSSEVYNAVLAGIAIGAVMQRERDAKLCDSEFSEYKRSMQEFDRRGEVEMGTKEARGAMTAWSIANAIRALEIPKERET